MKKTVVITGGTEGIGRAISLSFARANYHVAIAARKDNGLANEIGEKAKFFATDVRKREDVLRLGQETLNWTGQIDCWINNAGVSQWRPIEEIDENFFKMIMETNLDGSFWGCQAAAKALKQGGSIINISSLAGKRGSANNSAYCASKFALNGVTQSLAKELGPKGIRVNAVCPVYITTDTIVESLKDSRSPAGTQSVEDYLNGFTKSNTALQRLPKAEDVADSCLYLASNGAAAITGQCINVDCGVLPQ